MARKSTIYRYVSLIITSWGVCRDCGRASGRNAVIGDANQAATRSQQRIIASMVRSPVMPASTSKPEMVVSAALFAIAKSLPILVSFSKPETVSRASFSKIASASPILVSALKVGTVLSASFCTIYRCPPMVARVLKVGNAFNFGFPTAPTPVATKRPISKFLVMVLSAKKPLISPVGHCLLYGNLGQYFGVH